MTSSTETSRDPEDDSVVEANNPEGEVSQSGGNENAERAGVASSLPRISRQSNPRMTVTS
jgi:hypothetical protein